MRKFGLKHDRQYTYYVIVRHILETIFAIEK